jgi:hypothetical protein
LNRPIVFNCGIDKAARTPISRQIFRGNPNRE